MNPSEMSDPASSNPFGGRPGSRTPRVPPPVPDHTLLRMIGDGSYGDVWLARNVMGTYRAVKVVYRDGFDDDRPYDREFDGIRRFEPISRAHESQLDVLHIGRNDAAGCFYYVMELADDASAPGHGLGDPETYAPRTLEHDLKRLGRLPFAECLRISLALANALKHLHDHGLAHRDIKPSNIIFVNGVPKLADIGLVTDTEATVTYVGAEGFMAPEGPGRPPADLYSLGKVIYEMCTGRDRMDFPALPTDFLSWPDRNRINELLAISLRACEPDPARRHGSAASLIEDLVHVEAGQSVRRLRRLEQGRRWAVAVVLLAVLVAGALVAYQAYARAMEGLGRPPLLREAETECTAPRAQGWAARAAGTLQKARGYRMDEVVRNQAMSTLIWPDARTIFRNTNFGADHLAFDRAGRRLLMDGGQGGGPVRIRDGPNGTVTTLGTSGRGPVWFTREGKPRQFRAVDSANYELVDLDDGRRLREFSLPGPGDDHKKFRQLVATVSPDGQHVAAALAYSGTNGVLRVWETETGRTVMQLAGHWSALAFSPDGTCLATGDRNGGIRVRALAGGEPIAEFAQGRAVVRSLAFGRDPRQPLDPAIRHLWLLAAGDAAGTVWFYQLSPPRLTSIGRGSYFDVYTVAFNPDGTTLASAGRECVRVWDVATGLQVLTGDAAYCALALAFSPEGQRLVVGCCELFGIPASVNETEWLPSRGVRVLRGLSSPTIHVTLSRDGNWLAGLASNWEIGIWNLVSNRLVWLLPAPLGAIADNADLAFSPDNRQFAFATSGEACVWDMSDGRQVRRWALPAGRCERLAFAEDSRLIVVQWDRDATSPGQRPGLRFWPLPGFPCDFSLARIEV